MARVGVGRGYSTLRGLHGARALPPATLPPKLPFSSPPLPEAPASQGVQVVQEHPGGPEGEEKESDPKESSVPPLGAAASGWTSHRVLADKWRRQRRQATHTCGPGCQALPIQSPGAPWVGVGGGRKRRERL